MALITLPRALSIAPLSPPDDIHCMAPAISIKKKITAPRIKLMPINLGINKARNELPPEGEPINPWKVLFKIGLVMELDGPASSFVILWTCDSADHRGNA